MYVRYFFAHQSYCIITCMIMAILNLGRMTGSIDVLCIALFGDATLESRECLFSNSANIEVKDDTGQLISSHPDWEEQTYAAIITAFSEEDDHVYLPRIITSKEAILRVKSSKFSAT